MHVLDFLIDDEDIWIVGAFSEGKKSGETLRGIAKWDGQDQKWVDATGKGGVGREVWSIGKAENGKIYFGGSFGGLTKGSDFFDGFKNGDPAHMAMSYDPASGEWAQLGSGLAPISFPETRMTVNGNDVWFVGDFLYIGPQNEGKKAWESSYIARWNDTIDFTKTPAKVAEAPAPSAAASVQEVPLASGNEHWSRAFPPPPRRKRPDELAHTAKTGMDAGTGMPDVFDMTWLGDTLYFVGNWPAMPNQRWFVWTYHEKKRLGQDRLGRAGRGGRAGHDAVRGQGP